MQSFLIVMFKLGGNLIYWLICGNREFWQIFPQNKHQCQQLSTEWGNKK